MKWTDDEVVLDRVGSIPHQKGTYRGKVQNNHIVDGTVTWTDKDHTAEGTWTATLVHTKPEDDPRVKEMRKRAIEGGVPAYVFTPTKPEDQIITMGNPGLGYILSKPKLVYPEAAISKNIEVLQVLVHAIVGNDGRVQQASAEAAEPFKSSAETAVKQYICKPFIMGGQPVSIRTSFGVTYSLAALRADAKRPLAERVYANGQGPLESAVPEAVSAATAENPIVATPTVTPPVAAVSIPSADKRLSPPPKLYECDKVAGNKNCATWIWDGNGGYNARWDHGETGHIAVSHFDGSMVQFLRQDASGKKLLATYTGRISRDEIVEGDLSWTIFGKTFHGSWTGTLQYGQ